MSVRRAKSSDAKGIAEVRVAAWRSAYRGLLPNDVLDRLSASDSERRWGERIAGLWEHVFVAEKDALIVGFAACGDTEDEDVDREKVGEIYVIYVHPDAWRQGLATALLRKAIRHLRQDGFEEVILWVLEGNPQAIGFYKAAGFEADGARTVKRRSDGTEMPVERYRRSVG